jgi:Tol biopolymer transport system component
VTVHRFLLIAGAATICAPTLSASTATPPRTPVPLEAQILDPSPGLKLRQRQSLSVRIRAEGGADSGVSWSLTLEENDNRESSLLATGTGPVHGEIVTQVPAEKLTAGAAYLLRLSVSVATETRTADTSFVVIDPQYVLIPFEEGNYYRPAYPIHGTDASANLLVYSGEVAYPKEIIFVDRASGRRKSAIIRVLDTQGVKLSSDGSRLYSRESFLQPGNLYTSGLGFFDVESGQSTLVASEGSTRYSLDASGRRLVYQGLSPDRTLQYFLYDETSGETRQLTDDPRAVILSGSSTVCPRPLGTTPLISGDGSTVVVITGATLGLVPDDETIGCRVFSYDAEERTWRHVASVPRSRSVDIPALSTDGRWLSFAISRELANGIRRGFPGLMNLDSGELRDPVVDVGEWTSFDSVITGDARGVVISTQADVDPRVGNADHNMELFYYDLETETFTQITETTGGIGRTPGGCESYRPYVSNDGSVLTFEGFQRFSLEQCKLDGPQRNQGDGFWLRLIRAVRIRPGNRGPVFDRPEDQRIAAGDTLTLNLSATDPDGDPISFFAQVKGGFDVPPGSEITDHHDGTATFRWPTRPENAGDWVLRVAAFDEGGGEVFHDVTISVVGEGPPLPSGTPTATATPSSTASIPASRDCPGDCNRDDHVGVDELVTATQIALGKAAADLCPALDCRGAERVTIDCLVEAVDAALGGCP